MGKGQKHHNSQGADVGTPVLDIFRKFQLFGVRLDVVVGHVRHQCFLFGLLQVCRTHLLRECHEWGLWHLHLRYRIWGEGPGCENIMVESWNTEIFITKLAKFPGNQHRSLKGMSQLNGKVDSEGMSIKTMRSWFLKNVFWRGDSWPKKKKLNSTPQKFKIALEKRWLEDYFPVGSRELFRVYVKLRGGGLQHSKRFHLTFCLPSSSNPWEINEKITSTMPMLELITQLHIIIRMEEMRYELRKI